MKFPTVFVNHARGMSPHFRDIVQKHLPRVPPTSIVVLSAHHESSPYIQISDYTPPTTNRNKTVGGGRGESGRLARRIQALLTGHVEDENGRAINTKLATNRRMDHGASAPLSVMFSDLIQNENPIPIISVSLHASMDTEINLNIGEALEPLREEGVLIMGSGETFHNFEAIFSPSTQAYRAANDFNLWLKRAIAGGDGSASSPMKERILKWEHDAPFARFCHPRKEHILPLFMAAAAAGYEHGSKPKVIFDTTVDNADIRRLRGFPATGFVFY